MTAPGTAAARFGCACLIGLVLGLWYGFLRPLRPKFTAFADGAFLIGAAWAWLYLGFGICRGDLRLGYMAGLAAGAFGWEWIAGQFLRQPFGIFWNFVGRVAGAFTGSVKNFLKKVKILFASAEKWVTIKWSKRRIFRRRSGGADHGRIQKPFPQRADRLPPQQTSDQGGGHRGYRVVYGGTADPAVDSE